MKYLIPLLFLLSLPQINVGQQLTNFEYSECMIECANDSSKILESLTQNNITNVKLQTYAPCGGDFNGDFVINLNELNLKYSIKPYTVILEGGVVKELISVADCNCMYRFNYKFNNLNIEKIDKILVNGETLKEIDSHNILEIIDLEIELESMDVELIEVHPDSIE